MDETSNLDVNDFELLDASPSKYPFLNSLDVDLDVVNRLTLHLDRIRSGSSAVLTSAIGKEHDPQSVIESWSKIFDSKRDLLNSTLLDLELSNLSKAGPRSIAKPWSERVSDVSAYYDKADLRLPVDLLSGIKETGLSRLRPLSYSDALRLLKNNTNSGLPYYTRKGKVKDRTADRIGYLLQRKDPCILFTRTQEGGKTRNVWGYPIADTLEEMRYYKPLLDFQRKLCWRSALVGPDEVSKSMTRIISKARLLDYTILSGDVPSFDTSVVPDMIRKAFYYVSQLFQEDYRAGLERICERFSSIGLLTPSGITSGFHGVPSGSTFTNEVDSIVQYLLIRYCDIDSDMFDIQGDDSVVAADQGRINYLKKIYSDCYMAHSDIKSSEAKDHAIYLQNLYHIDYVKNGIISGIYPTYRAINRILYQESWSDFEDFGLKGVDYYSIRTISILENCKHHPLFKDLVEFVFRLDKYGLKYSRDAISKYDRLLNDGKGAGGLINNQYGDNVRGINSFETVKILKTLR